MTGQILRTIAKTYKTMKTFDDLKFEPHPIAVQAEELRDELPESLLMEYLGATQAVEYFDNGYGISVVCGRAFYSNGRDTYEAAALRGDDIDYDNPIVSNGVAGNLTAEEVSGVMRGLQEL